MKCLVNGILVNEAVQPLLITEVLFRPVHVWVTQVSREGWGKFPMLKKTAFFVLYVSGFLF